MNNIRILDLGCGNKKRVGAIGLDINPKTCPDIVHDLNEFPYPFVDSTFEEIYVDNVLEHLNDVIKVMEELHRIARPGAQIKIDVPYFRAHWAFIDPTHKHFFTTQSFAYFDPDHTFNKLYPYSSAKFKIQRIVFNEEISERGLVGWVKNRIKTIANKHPGGYELYLSHFIPLDEITFYLKAVK